MNSSGRSSAPAGLLRRSASAAVRFFLGPQVHPVAPPDRVRNALLVCVLLAAVPALGAAAAAKAAWGVGMPLASTAGFLLASCACLVLLRRGAYPAAVDALFFGIAVSAMGGFALEVAAGRPAFAPVVALLLFAAVILVGLYAQSPARAGLMLALALGFDLAEAFVPSAAGYVSLAPARHGIVLMHAMAYGFARFAIVYQDRLQRLAEARRVMNRRLEELVAEARASGAARLEAFGHDIKSPVTALIGVQALLEETDLDEEQKRYVAILGKSNRLILDLVESILGDRPAGRGESTRRLLEDAVEPFRAAAEAKGVELVCKVAGDPPAPPMDAAEARRVLGNLAENALRYTDSGSVVVAAAVSPARDGRLRLVLSVADSGRGMDPVRLADVRAGEPGPDPAFPASRGLGLRGVRGLVEAAGGSLEIESVLGKGTTAILRFPLD